MGKRLAIISGVAATVVVIAASLLFKEQLVEQWYIFRLGSSDDVTRLAAVDKLGEMKSVRAIPTLIRLFEDDRREGCVRRPAVPMGIHDLPLAEIQLTPVIYALYRVGLPTLWALPPFADLDQSNRHLLELYELLLRAITDTDVTVSKTDYGPTIVPIR